MRRNGIASVMISSLLMELNNMEIKHYTKDRIPDVLQFERDLRSEENFWGWEIDEKYIADVTAYLGRVNSTHHLAIHIGE